MTIRYAAARRMGGVSPIRSVGDRGGRSTRGESDSLAIRAPGDGGFNRSLQQDLVESFARSIPSQGFAWSPVETVGSGVEVGLGEPSQADALGEVLAQQAVGVLVAAALPRR